MREKGGEWADETGRETNYAYTQLHLLLYQVCDLLKDTALPYIPYLHIWHFISWRWWHLSWTQSWLRLREVMWQTKGHKAAPEWQQVEERGSPSLRVNFTADKGLEFNQWDFQVTSMQLSGADWMMERWEEGRTEVKELEKEMCVVVEKNTLFLSVCVLKVAHPSLSLHRTVARLSSEQYARTTKTHTYTSCTVILVISLPYKNITHLWFHSHWFLIKQINLI